MVRPKSRGQQPKTWSRPSCNPQGGMRVRHLRKEQRLTQRALAAKAGLTVDAVVRLENGRDVFLSTIEKIAEALGTTLYALYAPIG
jgi:transcriptional regulator with XRE-family HTH domain